MKARPRIPLSSHTKQALLVAVTSLAFAYVRHGIESDWAPWESIEQFLGYWLVHCVGLIVLAVGTVLAIWKTHRFFLGEESREAAHEELLFYICTTVLVATICAFVLSHWPIQGGLDNTDVGL